MPQGGYEDGITHFLLFVLIAADGTRVAGPTPVALPHARRMIDAEFIAGPNDDALRYGTYFVDRTRVKYAVPADAPGQLGEPSFIPQRTAVCAERFSDGRVAILHTEHVHNDDITPRQSRSALLVGGAGWFLWARSAGASPPRGMNTICRSYPRAFA